MRIPLTDWLLAGYEPFTPLHAVSAEIGRGSGCVTEVIPATVPGSVYADLAKAGIIPDPYYERNSLLCEWVANRFWVYQTDLCPTVSEGDRVFLHLEGLDYHAHIFLGDEKLGEHENMFTPFDCEITSHLTACCPIRLRVVLENAPNEMGQIGYTERTHTQKARYTYKWDFGARMVGMGIWREAWIEVLSGPRIGATQVAWDGSKLHFAAEVDRAGRVMLLLSKDGRVIADDEQTVEGAYQVSIPIEQPDLWYPNGVGAQPLYEIDLFTLTEEGERADHRHLRTGLRSLTYRTAAGASPSSLPYLPVINGVPVYIKGVNCVPMELMTGTESPEKRRHMLQLVKNMGCNLVRVWGGGIIENEDFYDLCDEMGLMVWQEMPQSSSGISNVPSKDRHFLSLLAETARHAAITKRNHVCLTFFSGGNELTDERGVPSTFEDENLAMLRSILTAYAPGVQMLPTSASGPTEYGSAEPGENHDVHGPWKYGGPQGHYERFNRSAIQLHSEFGCDGMTHLDALDAILSPAHRDELKTVEEDLVLRHKGEWWDTYRYRDLPLFGELSHDPEGRCLVSQYLQAEGLRYALEANRRRQWSCVGSIIWQFNEPWSGVYGTNLVDYHLRPKLAYYFCADALARRRLSLRYDSLTYSPDQVFRGGVYLHDDASAHPVLPLGDHPSLRVTVLDEHRIPAASFDCGAFSFRISRLGRSFTVKLQLREGEDRLESEYLFFVLSPEHPTASVQAVKRFVKGYLSARGQNGTPQ